MQIKCNTDVKQPFDKINAKSFITTFYIFAKKFLN